MHPSYLAPALHAPVPLPARRTVATVAVLALLLLVVQAWLPRLVAPATRTLAPAQEALPFDADSVRERASHALTAVPGRPGSLEVDGSGYRARFDRAGLTYHPDGSTGVLGISLRSIARGDRALALDVRSWRSDLNVARRSVGPDAVEQVTARHREIEWDVVLASPPAGSGDLVVAADLTGLAAAPVRAGAAWVLEVAGGDTVRLGETVVVDAGGVERFRGLPEVDGDSIALRVPHDALEGAAYPVVVDPTVSDPTPIASGEFLREPSVAFDGEDYLVVWNDANQAVHGAQVSGDGALVQPIGAISGDIGGFHFRPDVAWNGSSFLVVWDTFFAGLANPIGVFGRRVSAAGFVKGSSFEISNPAGDQSAPAITAAGSTFYVTWSDSRSGNPDVYGGRVTAAGGRLDGDGVAVATETVAETEPDVAWNGTDLLVAYTRTGTTDDVYGRRVSASAAPVGSAVVLSDAAASQSQPTVASGGTGFIVAWADTRNDENADVFATRVDAGGSRLDPNGIPVSTEGDVQNLPAVAYDGTYLVAWRDLRRPLGGVDVYAARVGTNGTVSDPSGFLVSQTTRQDGPPAVAGGPGSGRWGVVYQNDDASIAFRTAAK